MDAKLPKIEAKKSLGQHFLNNSRVPSLMADAGDVKEGDTVLEIGPGTGVLTRELLSRGARVLAIETDERAVEALHSTFTDEITAQKLTIIAGDVREIDLGALGLRPSAYKVVANIPYYISGFLFRTFLEHDVQPSTLVFLVQKEVAERIARDKKESLLSLSIKVFGTPHYIKTIGKGNFTPSPKVDSAIVAVTGIDKKNFADVPQSFFFMVLHEGFKSKRKQLIGNLTSLAPRDTLSPLFVSLNIPLTARGEDLSISTWLSLVHMLYTTHAVLIHRKH